MDYACLWLTSSRINLFWGALSHLESSWKQVWCRTELCRAAGTGRSSWWALFLFVLFCFLHNSCLYWIVLSSAQELLSFASYNFSELPGGGRIFSGTCWEVGGRKGKRKYSLSHFVKWLACLASFLFCTLQTRPCPCPLKYSREWVLDPLWILWGKEKQTVLFGGLLNTGMPSLYVYVFMFLCFGPSSLCFSLSVTGLL